MNITSLFCKRCGKVTAHRREEVNHILFLLLGFVTCGIAWIIWIALAATPKLAKCETCGTLWSK